MLLLAACSIVNGGQFGVNIDSTFTLGFVDLPRKIIKSKLFTHEHSLNHRREVNPCESMNLIILDKLHYDVRGRTAKNVNHAKNSIPCIHFLDGVSDLILKGHRIVSVVETKSLELLLRPNEQLDTRAQAFGKRAVSCNHNTYHMPSQSF